MEVPEGEDIEEEKDVGTPNMKALGNQAFADYQNLSPEYLMNNPEWFTVRGAGNDMGANRVTYLLFQLGSATGNCSDRAKESLIALFKAIFSTPDLFDLGYNLMIDCANDRKEHFLFILVRKIILGSKNPKAAKKNLHENMMDVLNYIVEKFTVVCSGKNNPGVMEKQYLKLQGALMAMQNSDNLAIVEFLLRLNPPQDIGGFQLRLEVLRLLLRMSPKLSDSNFYTTSAKNFYLALLPVLPSTLDIAMQLKILIKEICHAAYSCGAAVNHRQNRLLTILHSAVSYNQPAVLDFLLTHMRATDRIEFLKVMNNDGLPPVHLCCWHQFTTYPNESRLECLKILFKHGGDKNKKIPPPLNYSPLKVALLPMNLNRFNEEIACYLINEGAYLQGDEPDPEPDSRPEDPNEFRLSVIYLALYHLSFPVVNCLLEKKRLNVHKPLESDKILPLVTACNRIVVLSSLAATAANQPADFRVTPEQLEIKKKALYYIMNEFIINRGSSTASTLFYFALVQRFRQCVDTFKTLLQLSTLRDPNEINNHLRSHLPLLMMSIMYGNLGSFKVLLSYGADPNFLFKPTLCSRYHFAKRAHENHRFVSFETMNIYFDAHGEDKEHRRCVCHLCLDFIKPFERVWACQEGENCDCRVCEKCTYFSLGKKLEGLNVHEICSRRCKESPFLQNYTNALMNTKVGARLREKVVTMAQGQMHDNRDNEATEYLDILQNANLLDITLVQKLSIDQWISLGMVNDQERIFMDDIFMRNKLSSPQRVKLALSSSKTKLDEFEY